MKHSCIAFMMLVSVLSVCAEDNPTPKPLKALLIAGGCCHDYAGQHKVLSEGIQARANVQVDVYWTDDRSTTPSFPLYEKDDWAEGYDVIIHDECAAGIKDVKVVERIINEHRSVPAVHLHCAMHSWRTGTDMWFKFLGLQSSGHGPKEPLTINFVDGEHPATKGLKGWTTGKEELYNNVKIFDARPLAKGKQIVKRKGVEKEVEAVVVWTNEQEGVRSFSTSLGHNTETVADSRYLELVTRGLLWSCEKLSPEYQTPFKGKNKVTFIKGVPNKTKKKKGKGKKGQTPQATIEMVKPKDATEIKMTASSVQMAPGHFPWKAVDGNDGTRWCASNDSYPQWLQIELNKPHKIDTI
ncbi:MAG: ThuA domain-containing protein, partial [Planctomycetota bacterium]|nr:ThuA domain-containing protein [Planctomycetota bacterium]